MDIIDILIIAFVIYRTLLIIQRSGAYQVFYGVIIMFAVFLISNFLGLKMLGSLLGSLRSYWILALIILFQPELRSILAQLTMGKNFGSKTKRSERARINSTLIDAVSSMSFRKTGALIVLENKRKLNEFIHGADILDAELSLRLILSIFNPKSVLHDGAIIVRHNRILAAKVVLPLSKNPNYVKRYGTRHLAAIGITELTDAIALVVSEQSGKISIAHDGNIQSDIAFEELLSLISDAIK